MYFCSQLSSAHTQHKDSHILCVFLQPLIICPHCNTKTAIYSVFLQPLIICLHCNTRQPYTLCISAATYHRPTLQHKDTAICFVCGFTCNFPVVIWKRCVCVCVNMYCICMRKCVCVCECVHACMWMCAYVLETFNIF